MQARGYPVGTGQVLVQGLGHFLRVHLVFGNIFRKSAIGQIFIIANGQLYKKLNCILVTLSGGETVQSKVLF